MESSLFTRIIAGEVPTSFIAEDEYWVAFLDINPRRPGHTLIVPRQQKQYLTDLSFESRSSLLEGVVEVQRRLTSHFGCTDFSVVIHDGPTAGQEIPHLHIHVIPRQSGDGGKSLLAMFPNEPHPGKHEPDFSLLAELGKVLQRR